MPVKPDPPTRALGRAIADAVARRALFVALHARDADRLLDHIQRVEAQRDALADALRKALLTFAPKRPPAIHKEKVWVEAHHALAALEEGPS